jgi:hypothetical protein
MIRKILIGISLIPSMCLAQVDSVSIHYSHFIDSANIQNDIKVLADDSLLGRNTGDIGQKKAENFIKNRFIEMGVAPINNGSYLQLYDVVTNEFNTVSLQTNEVGSHSDKDVFSTVFFNDTVLSFDQVVFAGYGISSSEYDDYEGISVKDKLVFMFEENPRDLEGNLILSDEEIKKWYNNDREKYAMELGAKGVVFVSTTYNSTKNYFSRLMKYRDISLYSPSTVFPSFYMRDAFFYHLFDCDSTMVVKYNLKNKSKKLLRTFDREMELTFTIESNRVIKQSSNVAGYIAGSDSDAPWIVLTAHYDHEGVRGDNVYNGADDNASGTSTVLAIAEAFSKARDAGEVFNNNVLFLLVSGEEKGLLGSKHYVTDPIIPLDKTMCNLNIDMIGRTDTKHDSLDNYVYIIGSDRLSEELHTINENMNDLYCHLDLDYTYNSPDDPNRFYERSDHYNFAKNGIPVIFYYNGTHKDYHKPSDTEDKIQYHLLVERARLVFHTTWYLAKRDTRMLN